MKNFNTNYKSELDIIDSCIPQIRAISQLSFSHEHCVSDIGVGKYDTDTTLLLSNLLLDITSGLEKYANAKLSEKKWFKVSALSFKGVSIIIV